MAAPASGGLDPAETKVSGGIARLLGEVRVEGEELLADPLLVLAGFASMHDRALDTLVSLAAKSSPPGRLASLDRDGHLGWFVHEQ